MAMVTDHYERGGVNLIGLQSSYEDIDYAVGGWRKDDAIVIGGATGSGKSSFVLSEMLKVARDGGTAVYLSLEMSARLLALRSLSAITGIPAMNIEKGLLTPESYRRVAEAARRFDNMPIYFYDQNVTAAEWQGILSIHKNTHGLDIAAIDYIGLMYDPAGKTPYERITNNSLAIRRQAKEFDIPYFLVAQLNRASLLARPTLSAIKETGQIENDAGVVIFPYRLPPEEQSDAGYHTPTVEAAELIIAKNRHGPNNFTIDAEFVPQQMLWRPRQHTINQPPNAQRQEGAIA